MYLPVPVTCNSQSIMLMCTAVPDIVIRTNFTTSTTVTLANTEGSRYYVHRARELEKVVTAQTILNEEMYE